MEATDQEIEIYRKRLNELTAKCSEKIPEGNIKEDLISLAREVGASTINSTKDTQIYTAFTWELISNIHQALQTASMSNICRRTREGYEAATKANNRAWIYAAIAFLSMVAAWIAALRN
jgi:hypothetical protein